ncbi:MAG: hypothetical protein MZV49_06210 [Rhodopseudomonas palustris]|nr:hypothetical protein [Rhodopseudomonas palustris]
MSPDGRHVVCANAGSDTLSVIDTRTDAVVETIWAKPSPADLFGAQPNALAFDPAGKTLYVANGTQNAVAVVAFRPGGPRVEAAGPHPRRLVSRRARLRRRRARPLHVANIKGHRRDRRPTSRDDDGAPGSTPTTTTARSRWCRCPPARELAALTRDGAGATCRREPHRRGAACRRAPASRPAPVPERIGEPSALQARRLRHQGEPHLRPGAGRRAATGNGDPRLCIFGERSHAQPAQARPRVRPARQHLLRRHPQRRRPPVEHDRASATDYLERSFAGWPRSYPDGMGEDEVDALAYSPAGFIWDNALRARHDRSATTASSCHHAVSVEATRRARARPTSWTIYRDFEAARPARPSFASRPDDRIAAPVSAHQLPSAGRWTCPTSSAPTQFIAELAGVRGARASSRNLIIICLPNDHTSGTSARLPHPGRACGRQRPRLRPASSRPSATAGSGRRPASSPSRTIRRTAGTT